MTIRSYRRRELINPRDWSDAALSGQTGKSGRRTARSELMGLLGRAMIALQDEEYDQWMIFRRTVTDAANNLQLAVLAVSAADKVKDKSLSTALRMAALQVTQQASKARLKRLTQIRDRVARMGAEQRRLGWGDDAVPEYDALEKRIRRALLLRDSAEDALKVAELLTDAISSDPLVSSKQLPWPNQ